MSSIPAPHARPALLVFIPTYNRIGKLRHCLSRVLAELAGIESEVVVQVCDNHSTDGTDDFLAGLTHPCLRVSRNDTNIGGPHNILRVHEYSALAEFSMILGDDDYLLSGALRRLVAYIRSNAAIDFYFLNSIAYPETSSEQILAALDGNGWAQLPPGGALKSQHVTDALCTMRDVFSPAVDEVLGGSLMCYAFRSAMVTNHVGPKIDEVSFGSMHSSYPHTLNWMYSFGPDTRAAVLGVPFTLNFWHQGAEWGRQSYHRVVTQGLGFVLFEQRRLGYISEAEFPARFRHYYAIARPSLRTLLSQADAATALEPAYLAACVGAMAEVLS